jgi:prevent-host-death family protein
MEDIGVRELKTHASEIVRQVKETGAHYVITHRGHPTALIIPIEEAKTGGSPDNAGENAWDKLLRLGKEIGKGWQSSKTATELLSESRR